MLTEVTQLRSKLETSPAGDRAALLLELAHQLWNVDAHEGLAVADEAEGLLCPERDPGAWATLSVTRSLLLGRVGRYAQALERLDALQPTLQGLGDTALLSKSWNARGIVLSNLGRFPEALQCFLASEGICEDARNHWMLCAVLNNLGVAYDRMGRHDEAFGYFQRSLRLSVAIGREDTHTQTLDNLGNNRRHLGLWRDALAYQTEALELSRASGNAYSVLISTTNMAECLGAQGERERAEHLFTEAAALARSLEDAEHLVDLLGAHAQLCRQWGQEERAASMLREAIGLSGRMGGYHCELTDRLHLAQVLLDSDPAEAAGQLRAALALPDHAGTRAARAEVYRHLAELARPGDPRQAGHYEAQRRQLEDAARSQEEAWRLAVPQAEDHVASWREAAARRGVALHLTPFRPLDASPARSPRTAGSREEVARALAEHFEGARRRFEDLAVLAVTVQSAGDTPEQARRRMEEWIARQVPGAVRLGDTAPLITVFALPQTPPQEASRLAQAAAHDRPDLGLSVGCCTTTAWAQAEDMLRAAERLLEQAVGLGGSRAVATASPPN